MALGIVVFSIVLVVLYDLRSVWKNRPLPCDIENSNCPPDRVCSRAAVGLAARCLPRATEAPIEFQFPFATNAGVFCAPLPPEERTDFNLFSLLFQSKDNSKVVAAADGDLLIHGNEIRILHKDGYVSSYKGLKEILAIEGPVMAGKEIGRSNIQLEFGIHYFNPKSEMKILKDSPAAGFSIPFKMSPLCEKN